MKFLFVVLVEMTKRVDTLFKVEQFLGVLCCSDSCQDNVTTGVVEGFVVFRQAMAACRNFRITAHTAERFFCRCPQRAEKSFRVRVVLFGAQSRHAEGRSSVAVAGP